MGATQLKEDIEKHKSKIEEISQDMKNVIAKITTCKQATKVDIENLRASIGFIKDDITKEYQNINIQNVQEYKTDINNL